MSSHLWGGWERESFRPVAAGAGVDAEFGGDRFGGSAGRVLRLECGAEPAAQFGGVFGCGVSHPCGEGYRMFGRLDECPIAFRVLSTDTCPRSWTQDCETGQ